MEKLICGQRVLDLSRAHIMGILNITPDSFSDGGTLFQSGKLNQKVFLDRATTMVADGASILDIGGESTRPNAVQISDQEEIDRVLPALELLVKNVDVIISIDTSNPLLIAEAAKLGAGLINDVRALEREGAVEAAVKSGLPVCLMHMRGSPQTMQSSLDYNNVVDEVYRYLLSRAQCCEKSGVSKDKIILDPGFGFGKTMDQNYQLLQKTKDFTASGYPILIGTSRKSMFGQLLNRDVNDRLAASLASVAYATMNGASILRVHDVKESADVVKVIEKLKNNELLE